MPLNTSQKVVNQFSDLKVMIVGDVMIDSYLWGRIDRISPEAPVPIVELEKKEKRLGGAANVAKNIVSVGASCVVCSVIGNDVEGDAILKLFEKNQISTGGIIKSSNRITSIKHRIISDSQQIIRIDEEVKSNLIDEDNNKLLSYIIENLSSCDVIILQDYDKGTLGENNITKIIESAKSAKVPVIVDPKKTNFLKFKNVDLFKPNFKELTEGLNIHEEKSIESATILINQLKEKLHIKNALITLSELGMLLSFEDNDIHIPTEAKTVLDVSGAGDTVIAIAALCYALKTAPEILGKISNAAAGIVCEELGVAPVNKKTLIDRLK